MKQLALEKRFEAIAGLKARIAERATEASRTQQEVAADAARGRFEKLGEAHTRTALLPVHIAALESELGDHEQALIEETTRLKDVWNGFVSVQVEATFTRFIDAINPFYGGKEKEPLTRREFEHVHIPEVHRLRRAYADLGSFRQLDPEQQLATAKRLVADMKGVCQVFGWDFSDDWKPAKRAVAPRQPLPSDKVRVRAISGEQCEQQKLKRGERPVLGVRVDDLFLANGKEAELSRQQYSAIARFVELVSDPVAAAAK
jgi:hypothetical protein